MSQTRARLLSLIPALVILLPIVPLPAKAEGSVTVSITAAHVLPAQAAVVAGRPFVLANDSGAIARVEFGLARGKGLPCSASGEPSKRGRKFLVEAGSELVCLGEPGRYDYTVFQNLRLASGEFVHRREEGRIEVR